MPVYLIADVKVTDESWIPDYAANVHDIVHKHGGKYLSRSANITNMEGEPLDPWQLPQALKGGGAAVGVPRTTLMSFLCMRSIARRIQSKSNDTVNLPLVWIGKLCSMRGSFSPSRGSK